MGHTELRAGRGRGGKCQLMRVIAVLRHQTLFLIHVTARLSLTGYYLLRGFCYTPTPGGIRARGARVSGCERESPTQEEPVFRAPFNLKLHVDDDRYYEQSFDRIPYAAGNDVYLLSISAFPGFDGSLGLP